MRKKIVFAEKLFTILSLVFYTGGILTVIVSGGVNEGEANFFQISGYPEIKVFFLIIYLITFLLVIARWKKVLYMLSKDYFILILVCIAIISIFWSHQPEATMIRSIGICGTTSFGLYLATRYTLKEQINLLGWTFAIVILLSLFFAIALPKYGIMEGIHAGAIRGIFYHKNVLGKMMVISTIVFILQTFNNTKNRSLIYLCLSLSIILLLLSKSSSAMINLLIILTLFLIFQIWRWRYDVMIPIQLTILMLIGTFSVWVNDNSNILFDIVGKDITLSGRTKLWDVVWNMIWKNPWIGYGYGAFWFGDSISYEAWYAAGWQAPNSHNGILDLWLNIGLLGVVIFTFSFLKTLFNSFICLRYRNEFQWFWPLIFIMYFILSNLTESALMLQNDISWILYVAIVYSVAMQNKKIDNTSKFF